MKNRLRKRRIVLSCLLAGSLVPISAALATDYYVATTGSDLSAGNLSAPYATITKAISSAHAGDTIYVRGGTYSYSATISIGTSKNGTAALPYNLYGYPGESAIVDFSSEATGTRGIQLNANYWHIRDLTVRNAGDNGIHIQGSDNTIERLDIYGNQDTGLQISGSTTQHPSNNLILNCDSHNNYDPVTHGENADGFAAKFRDIGPGNVFRGDRAFNNADDGWDFWAAAYGVTVDQCWSFKNGFNIFGDSNWQGDGNGWKLGHDSGTHVITNSVAWGNRLTGIDINGNATVDSSVSSPYVAIAHGVTIENVTTYNNGTYNFYFDENYAHVLKNNVSFLSGSGNSGNDWVVMNSGVAADHNTWNGAAFVANAADFLSLNDLIASGPRQADGSLPFSNFLHLVPGSNLIDSGINVGIPYFGSAPDLGAFEVVPEPATWVLILAAAPAALLLARRKQI